jgi:hypothetical protein
MAAQHTHRRGDGLADHRLAGAADQLLEDAIQIPAASLIHADDAPGQHQRPCGRVHEQRIGFPAVAVPIAWSDLVADQPVGGLGVRHTQQCLGKAHQRHPFLGGKSVFLGEGVDAAAPAAFGADASHEFARQRLRRGSFRRREFRLADPFGGDGVLVGEVGIGDGLAQFVGHGAAVVRWRVHSSASLPWRANLLTP